VTRNNPYHAMEASCREARRSQFHGVSGCSPYGRLTNGHALRNTRYPPAARRVKSALGRWPPTKTVSSVGNNFGANTDMINAAGEREYAGVISITKLPTTDRDVVTRG